jgi:hypothetical protein
VNKSEIIQGKTISRKEIDRVKQILDQHPDWHRTKISQKICEEWNWRNDKGRLKDIACRSLLRKLESKGLITLPVPRRKPVPRMKDKRNLQQQFSFLSDLSGASTFKEAVPLTITIASPGTTEGKLFAALLAEHHYLGYKGSVGEHLAYLVKDAQGSILACLLFGAPAWKIAPRDKHIGWQDEQRQKNLKFITNNMRFLLLNKIPHVASHILGRIARRISQDWQDKYGHGIVLLETFVEIDRFKGTCYRAANWINVGETQGRSRNDRYSKLQVPVKHIYLYPVDKDFKEKLCV